ncbi:CBS domain-containing protein [Epibacterium ulvae]|uniref:DUF294 nucleotidyltransferase-like domain-containing protein n=1 Tax=Epibacterium ulvae TaxID=1156985 RepID=UPI001BFC4FFE|nr:DUF294 nucleotidyltransferase-like domain-containing protein [Epibacterium ulvae]MBT8156089.1 CBS domain-containing protein [Epibacterium ulvae]
MALTSDQITRFLKSVHPYDSLEAEALDQLAQSFTATKYAAGSVIYQFDRPAPGLFLIYEGAVEVTDGNGAVVSHLGLRNSFGERGLLRDGIAVTTARAEEDSLILRLSPPDFERFLTASAAARKFFDRSRAEKTTNQSLANSRVLDLMAVDPKCCAPDDSVHKAAQMMRDHRISSLCVGAGGHLLGILTTKDMTNKVVANGLPPDTPVGAIMARDPLTLPPTALGSDVLHLMISRRIGHVPIVENGALVGMITQTDLTRFQAVTSAELLHHITDATSAAEMAEVTARIPSLLVHLVGAGNRHEVVTRLITDVADAVTLRLLELAEDQFGAAPVPYLWLACGSQGRREQTGVSDQDNCLILHDNVSDADKAYFQKLAHFVCDGLNTCGYVYCPGDMMATNPRWCQPLKVWRDYFDTWITKPDPEAQMLASVMFDLRAIAGDRSLFADLQEATLDQACENSIFVAHMMANSLKHTPPLGLLRGLATIRSGEHKNQLDLKHNGVVPVVDLGRIYALQGKLTSVNSRARLEEAAHAGGLSASGAHDLLDAYDMIAETRLHRQAALIKQGKAPDNYLLPAELSDLERSHLRDAFVVVKTMQSAAAQGRGVLS